MAHPAQRSPDQEPTHQVADPAIIRTRAVLDRVFGSAAERSFDIHLWDGSVDRGMRMPGADFALAFRRRGALRRMLLPPSELTIAESFVSGDVDIQGRMESAMGITDAIGERIQTVGGLVRLLPQIIALPKDDDPEVEQSRYQRARGALSSSRKSEAEEIRFHYDVGNDFYALWLDSNMLYTCAYYETPQDSLADAQVAKLDHICRKLRLQKGQRMLDIGCGWGALIQHAVQHYGVEGLGITLSAAQAEWAQRQIAERGLAGRCRVEVMDFRDLPPLERFDRISSVGVTEHVPEDQQPAYFRRAFDLLTPGGLMMNHCEVSLNAARATGSLGERVSGWLWKRDQFIDRYVFPDARLVALGSIISSAERSGFETRDVECLREHYTLTLRAWVRNLERHKAEAIALVGERTYRVWQLYMTVAAYSFDTGAISLVQTLLAKPNAKGEAGLPLTRDYMAGIDGRRTVGP